MNRLQKKCFIVATGLHLLLLLLLVIGPAFRSTPKPNNVPLIDFVPLKVIDANIPGGGNPNANPLPPPPIPQPPQPPVPTPPVAQETTRPEPTRPEIPDAVEPRTERSKPPKPTDSKVADNNNRQIAEQITRAAAGLRNNLAPTTTMELRGPRGGGETYAGFDQNLLSIYDRAWISPEGMDSSEAVVSVKVTIESDGKVSSAQITQASGDPRVDRSVREALNRVSSVQVPDGMKRRTVEFNFRSRAKQAI